MSAPDAASEVRAAPCRAPLRIGPLNVRTDPTDVEAFRRAAGHAGDRVPLVFPMRWLTGAPLRAALVDLVNPASEILVHESQSFEYETALRIGEDYVMTVEAHREAGPDRLLLRATLATPLDVFCGRFDTVLRIIADDRDRRP